VDQYWQQRYYGGLPTRASPAPVPTRDRMPGLGASHFDPARPRRAGGMSGPETGSESLGKDSLGARLRRMLEQG
jgi:hypothetical protein